SAGVATRRQPADNGPPRPGRGPGRLQPGPVPALRGTGPAADAGAGGTGGLSLSGDPPAPGEGGRDPRNRANSVSTFGRFFALATPACSPQLQTEPLPGERDPFPLG